MNNLPRGLIVLICCATTASAVPQFRIGENAELFATGRVAVHHDDNVLLSDLDELSDTVFEVAPGLEFSFGQGALTSGTFTYVETISRFIDNDFLDRELSAVEFLGNYEDGKLKLEAESFYRQLNQNTRDVRGPFPVRRDVFGISLSGEVFATQKSSIGTGLSFDRTDYKRDGYVDSEEFNIPVSVYYHWREKIDLSAGVRYRETQLDGGFGDSSDFFYNVGARGDFTPKFSGEFNVGFVDRSYDAGGSDSSLGVESAFRYRVSEKTSLRFGVGNDFGTSAEGSSQRNFMLTLGAETDFSEQWQAGASVTYRKIEYIGGRTDDFLYGQLSGAYRLNRNVKFSASYQYRKNDSDFSAIDATGRVRSADFTNNLFTLAADIRY
jgi:polysaccharide biosynthesis protein VpsM